MKNKYTKLFFKELIKYKKYHLSGFFLMILNTILALLLPSIIMKIIDKAIVYKDGKLLIKLVIVYLIIVSLQGIVKIVDDYIYTILGQKISLSFKRRIMESIYINVKQTNYNSDTGEILTLIQDDSEVVEQIGTRFLFSIVMDITVAAAMFLYLAWIQFDLLLITIIFQVLILICQVRFNRQINSLSDKLRGNYSSNISLIQEYVVNIKEIIRIKAFEYFNKRYSKIEEVLRKNNINIQLVISFNSAILSTLGAIITIVVLGIGGYKVITGVISVGTLLAFNIYCQKLISPFTRLSQYSSQYSKALISLKRIYDFLDNTHISNNSREINEEDLINTNITFENVKFSYKNKVILDGLSIEFEKNKINTIVGKNGVGKSTILRLILGELDGYSGTIKFNNIEQRKLNKDNLRALISIVSQDVILFNDTIYNNITLLNEEITREKVTQVLRKVGLFDEVMNMENGIDTNIGENGSKLSGGQKQKISIARAIINKKPIIIFDEATSLMDNKSEQKFVKLIRELSKDKTIIMIAHRRETVEISDKIIYLEEGIAQEVGKHKELLDLKNKYYELYNKRCLSIG